MSSCVGGVCERRHLPLGQELVLGLVFDNCLPFLHVLGGQFYVVQKVDFLLDLFWVFLLEAMGRQ